MPEEKKEEKKEQQSQYMPARMVSALADEVAKTLVERLPHLLTQRRSDKKKKTSPKVAKKLEKAIFLDTSAIIDTRIFDIAHMGLFRDVFVIPEKILLELKHIADSQDTVKRERGRRGLELLEKLKKAKGIQVVVVKDEEKNENHGKMKEVDEILIATAKKYHGRILTCDYNLEKKATIQGVTAVNVNALANALKIRAVPGEALHVKLLHQGKDITQGVAYLDDGTMIVVEQGAHDLGRAIDVVVSRVIQTTAGRILFAKKI